MRTTLIIDDDVAAAARHRAVSEGITLSALVTQALRAVLQEGSTAPDPPFSMVTWGATGPPLHLTPRELAAGPEPFALSPLVVGRSSGSSRTSGHSQGPGKAHWDVFARLCTHARAT